MNLTFYVTGTYTNKSYYIAIHLQLLSVSVAITVCFRVKCIDQINILDTNDTIVFIWNIQITVAWRLVDNLKQ